MRNRSNHGAALVAFASLSILTFTPAFVFAQTPPAKRKPADLPQGTLIMDGSPVHNIGELWCHVPNWGLIGSMPDFSYPFSHAPSAEWPGGSGVEYLWDAGLWVGALRGNVPSVTTAARAFEFLPSPDPRDIVYYSSSGVPRGNRLPSPYADDDGDGSLDEDALDGFDNDLDGLIDEDYAAISDQMLSRNYRDDDERSIRNNPSHSPQHLAVHQETYQFEHPDFDDFIGFTLNLKNDGTDVLEDVYVSLFAEGDVGRRDNEGRGNDDATGFANGIRVDHHAHGSGAYDFVYWYDADGDGGQATGYCGFVMLDHPVDALGESAPREIGFVSYENFSGGPVDCCLTNDFERYEFMASQSIEEDRSTPRDYWTVVAAGPFAQILPGESITLSFALVVTPRNEVANVAKAAIAYQGQWFDLDNDPSTGIDGKEHQEHWYLPNDNPSWTAFNNFRARAVDPTSVIVEWQASAEADILGYDVFRVTSGGGEPQRLTSALLPGDQRRFVDASVTPGGHYGYFLVAHGTAGEQYTSQSAGVKVPAASVVLRQNAPNPFAATTRIGVSLPARSDMRLAVYDVTGRRVASIANGARDAGEHEFEWNGTNDAGGRVGAGVYFCKLEAGTQTLTKKLVLMR